jgi:hypothetical protein
MIFIESSKKSVFHFHIYILIAIFLPIGQAESHRIFRLAARRSEAPRLPRRKPKSAAISACE